jgi:glycosyltransferase involved in cell wall biosynthesis
MKVAMISPMPAISGAVPESGVSGYAYSLVTHMPPTVAIDVVAQKSAVPFEAASGVHILHSWRPGLHAANDIVSSLRRIDVDLIHLQHEFRIFGGTWSTAAVVEQLRRRRTLDAPITTTLHGVVPMSEIDNDFLRRYDIPGKPQIAQRAIRLAHRSVRELSTMTIVHHPYFKEVLVNDYSFDESSIAVVLPGALSNNGAVEQSNSESSLPHTVRPIKNVLVFGFLTSYKLPELVVDVASATDEPIHFTFCVSKNPRAESKSYLERYESLKKSVFALGDRATWSGYVPDAEVPRFFENTDLLVLPYVDCISVSAVASLADAHGVKICFSEPLRPLFSSSNLEFDLTVPSLASAITRGLNRDSEDPDEIPNLVSWEDTARQTTLLWQEVVARRRSG